MLARLISPATRVVLAHEWRLALRGLLDMAGPKGPLQRWRFAAIVALTGAVIVAVSHVLLQDAGALDPADPRVQITVAINLAFLFVLMISAALDSAAYALYARDDYDLLFSAPLSPRAVLLVRALNVFGFTLAKAALYGAPMLLLLAVERGPHWLAGLPLLLALALAATASAIALGMGMVRLIGVRATRVAAQVAAALAGLLVLVMVQWEAIFGPGPKQALTAAYAAAPASLGWALLVTPAKALMGDPGALALVAGLSAALAAAAFLLLADSFVRNAVLAAGSTGAPAPRARRSSARFGGSPFALMMLKERRLILRDPWLLSQILMQCIFLLPVAVVSVYRVLTGAGDAASLAPVLIVLCGQIAGGLTWIALAGDDAPELAATAPLDGRLQRRARMAAIAWLTVIFTAPPLALVLWFAPWTGLVTLLGVGVAIGCGILVNLWHQPRFARAGLIRRRMKSPVTVTLMELSVLTLVAVAAWPLIGGNVALSGAASVLVVVVMIGLWLARRREAAA
jgi:ABC-2 type transport system permease protein